MNTSHTPPPWRISRTGETEGSHPNRVQISGRSWGRFASVVVRMNGDNFDSPEGSANARLIASAPDMLSALQTALACLENLQEVQIWEEDQGDHITEALEAKYKIQAAIKAATSPDNG
jgi:hypothetical protein